MAKKALEKASSKLKAGAKKVAKRVINKPTRTGLETPSSKSTKKFSDDPNEDINWADL